MDYKDLLNYLLQDPSATAEVITTTFETYKPLIYKVANELFGIYKDYINFEEIYEYGAKYQMGYYQALINAGFTEDQAFTLLLDEESRRDKLKEILAKTSKADVSMKH